MPRPAHHAPEHQALVVNLPGGAANRLLHADRGRFQGAILGLMWLELLSVLQTTIAREGLASPSVIVAGDVMQGLLAAAQVPEREPLGQTRTA